MTEIASRQTGAANDYAIKWGILLMVVLLVALFIGVSYRHARSRVRKGLVPLSYHRWMFTAHTPVEEPIPLTTQPARQSLDIPPAYTAEKPPDYVPVRSG